MTTRMLLKGLLIILLSGLLGSCSLFSSGEEDAITPDQMDQSSVANSDDLDDEDGEPGGLDDESIDEFEESASLEDEGVDEDDLDGDDGELDDLDDDDDGEFELSDDDTEDAISSEFEELEGELSENGLNDDESGGDDIASDELAGENNFDEPQEDDFEGELVVASDDSEEVVLSTPEEVEPTLEVVAEDVAPVAPENQVVNLEYKSFDNGGTVVIETTSPTSYNVREEPDLNQVIVELDDVNLPERFKRPYITKDFKQDVATINAYQGMKGSTARFVIQMKRPLKPYIQQSDNSILVMTNGPQDSNGDSLEMAATQTDNFGNPIGEPEMAEFTPRESIPDESQGMSNGNGLPEDSNTLGAVAYKGKKINIEVVDTDVREVIQIISEESGVNLIMDQDVKGKVSFRLRKVPWDQALMVVLRSQALGYKRQGNVLRIAKQATLSSEAQQISKQIENEKQAQLLAGGLKVKYIPVSYAKVEILQKKLKDFSSKDGKVTFDNRTSSIVISDYEEYIERMSKLVSAMDIPSMQVEIEAKIIEAREDFSREVGINWGFSGQQFGAGGEKTATIGGNSNPFSPAGVFPGLTLDFQVGTFNIFGDLTASLGLYERQNKIKVLSSPKILAMNKVKSKILQNTQIPIQRVSTTGATTIEAIDFKDLILSLDVTPQITFKGDVIMDVKLKREFAGAARQDGGREINTREAETTVMVKNGETAVIGGIYQSDVNDGDGGVPILKDIPFIGGLFRNKTKERQKNELLLFLKPRILGTSAAQSGLAQGDTGTDFQDLERLNVDEGETIEPEFADSGDEEFSDDFEEETL